MSEDYAKFKQYWIDLGEPDLEIKKKHEEDTQFCRRLLQKIEYFDPKLDYRLAGDRHWRLRKEWIDSDFKMPIEVRIPNEEWHLANENINWDQGLEYRKKPSQSAVEMTEELMRNMGANTQDADPEEEQQPAYPEVKNGETLRIDWESGGATKPRIKSKANPKEQDDDTGRHYRFVYDAVVTPEAANRGFVSIKLDPFRIAAIYGLTDFALQTILKKTLCAGNRGHNTLREDLKDIICAAQRKLEMLDEDETTPTIPENQ